MAFCNPITCNVGLHTGANRIYAIILPIASFSAVFVRGQGHGLCGRYAFIGNVDILVARQGLCGRYAFIGNVDILVANTESNKVHLLRCLIFPKLI